jgi:hypothetical protein
MNYILVPRPASSPKLFIGVHAPETGNILRHGEKELHADQQFVAMLDSYRLSGGLARAHEVGALFKCRCTAEAASLDSMIIEKKVISFAWQSQTWLPLFQFNRTNMAVQPEVGQVLTELSAVHDTWEQAVWFSRPNPWLSDRVPADKLLTNPHEVLNAARADRYIARG